jgi:hypothetical protein
MVKVAEGDRGWVGRDPGTRLMQKTVDRLRSKDGDWGGVLGGRDLNDELDRDLGETQELGILGVRLVGHRLRRSAERGRRA